MIEIFPQKVRNTTKKCLNSVNISVICPLKMWVIMFLHSFLSFVAFSNTCSSSTSPIQTQCYSATHLLEFIKYIILCFSLHLLSMCPVSIEFSKTFFLSISHLSHALVLIFTTVKSSTLILMQTSQVSELLFRVIPVFVSLLHDIMVPDEGYLFSWSPFRLIKTIS